MKRFRVLILLLLCPAVYANVVNVYVWGGEIPKEIIQRFEKETGITVNFSTYDSNETMYAKLKASRQAIYDVILPSAYFVERMVNQGMLTKLNHRQLPNITNLDQRFTQNDYDKGNQYSIPFIWGTTGIFFNQTNVSNPPKRWQGLWDKRWLNQLMMLDDSREVFAIALLSLGFDPNSRDPNLIRAAYQQLVKLAPNIKLFASDSIQAIMIDEDSSLGVAWNADAYKAAKENKEVNFIYPEDGFVIWVDCLAIPKNAPHQQEALTFINFLLKPDVVAQLALISGQAITNAKGRALLPEPIRNNTVVYPPANILARGYFQRDVGEETLALYNQYWQQLKLVF
ncbi:spermidine/putrescine transport system substrate-binding protein [Legionella beliardensis]|uniref:Putrescine-binding periplasmic protein n=1 Tax=Legionella beliardensis TaxID=91822 RepID=A0A378HZK1_9GAMM|nr:spermidine/putrescine ABC transporter substrate-binding protein [Legionella beliardensis]STX28368.1 spermidine/putrescine transport system substrate-binding protein [Legionella beliardensis]